MLPSLSFSLKVHAGKTDSRFRKTFYGDIFLCLLNIFETAAPKSVQKIEVVGRCWVDLYRVFQNG